jgi:hypothetical protein
MAFNPGNEGLFSLPNNSIFRASLAVVCTVEFDEDKPTYAGLAQEIVLAQQRNVINMI